MATSVAQEFYKLREEWEQIDRLKSWRLAVWVAEYPDVDIIDKFIEIERSPIGIYDDLFFRFESVYKGDVETFEAELWEEFISWFAPSPKPELAIHQALYEGGLITTLFVPDVTLAPTAKNLWTELVRFRALIEHIDAGTHFCLYFPMVAYNTHPISEWFAHVLKDIPKEIRLLSMDFAQDRKIKIVATSCVYLFPKLNMVEAIKNEMAKDSGNYNTVDVHARFRKQVMKVMDSTTEKINNTTGAAVEKLLGITQEIGGVSAYIAGQLVAAQAFYARKDNKQSEQHTDEALRSAREAMAANDSGAYDVWKSCMLLKAALHYGRKEKKQALAVYEEMADTASKNGDAYYVMEGRRLMGHISYELGNRQEAFENMLLALTAGSYLDINLRRQSTFLHAAYMALYLADRMTTADQLMELKLQLADWLGEDWEGLLQQAGVENASIKMKTSIFS